MPVSEKMKRWIDDISELFGGLEICSIEAVVAKDGKEHILEVCGSTLTLLGESQEEDRKNISDLIVQRMNAISKATLMYVSFLFFRYHLLALFNCLSESNNLEPVFPHTNQGSGQVSRRDDLLEEHQSLLLDR